MDDSGIEFLFWAECPSWERALALVRERVAAAGGDPDSIAVTELTTEEQAARLGFPGSPTIRVGGVDVQQPVGLPIGLSCRIYRRPDGRVSPLPSSAEIDDALAASR
jgi:hypothetical protein